MIFIGYRTSIRHNMAFNSKLLNYTCFLFLVHFVSVANGQVQIKLGVHSFDLQSPTEIVSDDVDINFREARLGFQGGIAGRVKFTNLFLETRVMLNSTSVDYTIDGENGGIIDNVRSESFLNLDIPLYLGFKIAFLDVYTGPIAHIHLNSESDLFDISGYGQRFDTAQYGWRFGTGINLGDISISLDYERNLSNFGDHISIAGQEFNFGQRPSRFLLNLGYKLF